MSKRSILSWSLYDWANSAFATTVMAGFFPIFFKEYWSGTDSVTLSTWYLGLANSIASILIALIAPLLGAISDSGTSRKKFLIFFAFLGVVMTCGLWTVQQGHWEYAVLFYVMASLGYMGGNIFYDSLLLCVSSPKNIDRVSLLGYAMGYIGGGILFLVNVLMYQAPELFGIPDSVTAIRISFVSVGVWWAIFSIPIILYVKEPTNNYKLHFFKTVKKGYKQYISTFREIKNYKVVVLFLVAFWLYIDGVHTVIKMAVDYGISLGFSASSLIITLLLVQFVAFPATLGYNIIAKKIGVKNAIYIAIIGYILITILGSMIQYEWHFYAIGILLACFQGGIFALSRSLYTRIIPKDKSAEFFGFYNMIGKFAAIIGPPMIGYIGLITGNPRIGILSLLILFILGGYVFTKVDIQKGQEHIQDNNLSKKN